MPQEFLAVEKDISPESIMLTKSLIPNINRRRGSVINVIAVRIPTSTRIEK